MTSEPAPQESIKVVGYADRLSVQPGQEIRFMVSCEEPDYEVQFVRLIHGDDNLRGPGFKRERITTKVDGKYKGRVQEYHKGSYVTVRDRPLLRRLSSFTIQAWIYPTRPGQRVQGIITRWGSKGSGYGLFIDESAELALWLRDKAGGVQRVSSGKKLQAFNWYSVSASYDGKNGRLSLHQKNVATCQYPDSDADVEKTIGKGLLEKTTADLHMAAYEDESKGEITAHYSGKIDGVKLYSRILSRQELRKLNLGLPGERASTGLIAAWDFSRDIHSTRIKDMSLNKLNGESVNFPTRAVTGHNWSGREYDFKRATNEYNAIYFHDDDLGDAGWKTDFALVLPDSIRSGVYAAHLVTKTSEDYVPFFVRPKRGRATAKICMLIPTLSYLAYANEHTLVEPEIRRNLGTQDVKYPSQRQDVYVLEHNLLSLYDRHSDRSGVCYTSRLRPILNMRPRYVMQSISSGKGSPHQFNADLHLVDWMETKGYGFDVITDEDLHHEGLKLISPYRVVVTGSHPEYWTVQMLDAVQTYLNKGGRLMYLGGNGFYWVTAVNQQQPYIFEVRRWGGTGAWMAEPGEYYHSFTGELGGLWRNRGRHPQKMVGVGFSAQGFDMNRPYKRESGSFDRRASFIFRGIGEDELIGDFPSLVQESGAAGFELDRLDLALGTPSHTLLLATATGFSDNYQHVIEENTFSNSKQGGTIHPLVKGDIVYLKYPKNGAVFSVGSISWCGSLSYNNYGNNVSRMTENVLARFSSDEDLP